MLFEKRQVVIGLGFDLYVMPTYLSDQGIVNLSFRDTFSPVPVSYLTYTLLQFFEGSTLKQQNLRHYYEKKSSPSWCTKTTNFKLKTDQQLQ